MDYFRPRGDITTVLDLTNRDAQDNFLFPLDTDSSWFHRGGHPTVYPSALSVQEFTQRGPAEWGGRFTFELGALPAGDLLQCVALQIRLGHWYDQQTINRLQTGRYTADINGNPSAYWTYANSLGTSIIEYAELVVKDQTIERIDGEFIRLFMNIYANVNTQFGVSSDGLGNVAVSNLKAPAVMETAFNPNRPWATENGVYFCILPFFFLRTRLKEVFPLLSCNEGDVRINVKLRPFLECIRNYSGVRSNCDDSPLGKTVPFIDHGVGGEGEEITVYVNTAVNPPIFQDFRILTMCSVIDGSVRNAYLRKPFEQMVKIVKKFHFDEPLKYIVSKPNSNNDTVDVSLPLELNHPTTEILWVFRRKAAAVNNEWGNFTPIVSVQSSAERIYPPWLDSATIRINGQELVSASGNWFREHISSVHKGGWVSWMAGVYGYSFAMYPDEHQPSGSANMSRTNSITLNMRVNIPYPIQGLSGFDAAVNQGWEVYVYAIHMNWLRFENGICNRLFED